MAHQHRLGDLPYDARDGLSLYGAASDRLYARKIVYGAASDTHGVASR